MTPTPEQLARMALAAAAQAPDPGVALLLGLLEHGTLTARTRTGRGGPMLMDALLEAAMARTPAAQALLDAVLAQPAERWETAAGPGALARPLEDGRWMPLALLERSAASPPAGGSTALRKLDAWLAAAMAGLALTSTQAHEAMAQALKLGLDKVCEGLWDRVDLARPAGEGKILLGCARADSAWERFLARGGDPAQPVAGGAALWLACLRGQAVRAPKPGHFAGAVERWAWGYLARQGGGDAQAQAWLAKTARSRVRQAGAGGLSTQDWLAVLGALAADSPLWTDAGQGRPLWLEVARATDADDFLAVLGASAVGARLDAGELARARARLLGRRLARAPEGYELQPLEAWRRALETPAWPQDVPAVLDVALGLMKGNFLRQVGRLAQAHPRHWWGPDDALEATGLALLEATLVCLADQKHGLARLRTLLALTQDPPAVPAVWVARGVAEVVAGGAPGLPAALVEGMAQGVAGGQGAALAQRLAAAAQHVPRKRRDAFQALVDAARLGERLAPAPVRRTGPGRL